MSARISVRWLRVPVSVALALVIAACGGGRRAGPAQPPPPSISTKNLEGFTDPKNLPASLDDLEKIVAATPRSSYEIAARAVELGPDVDKTFAFVRDQVRYEVYEGALRGPLGTLLAMAGNSYDKSLLLGALLNHHGVEVRYARALLAETQATQLVQDMFAGLKQQDATVATPSAGIPAVGTEAMREFAKLVTTRWLDSLSMIRDALEKAKLPMANSVPVSIETLRGEAADHLWLEYRRNDQWIALDASTKGAQPGMAPATPTETHSVLPQSLYHMVRIRMMLEERGAGVTKARELLRYEATAANLEGARVALRYDVTASQLGWFAKPVLEVNDQTTSGEQVGGGGAGRSIFGRPGEAPGQARTEMVAQWLEFEFVYPPGRSETVMRHILDRLGPAARATGRTADAELAPLEQNEGVPVYLLNVYALVFTAGPVSPGRTRSILARSLPVIKEVHREQSALQAGGRDIPQDKARQLATRLAPVLPDLLGMAALSLRTQSRQFLLLAQRPEAFAGVWFFEASPRLAIVSTETFIDGSSQSLASRVIVDLRRNSLRVVAEGGAAQQVIWANAARGILDGVLEHVLFVDLVPASPGLQRSVSTIGVLEQAQQAGTGLSTLTSTDGLNQLAASDDVKARVALTLATGATIVSPVRTVTVGGVERLGWWGIDRNSGETLAIMDTGLQSAEYPLALSTKIDIMLLVFVYPIVAMWSMWYMISLFMDIGRHQGRIEMEQEMFQKDLQRRMKEGSIPPNCRPNTYGSVTCSH